MTVDIKLFLIVGVLTYIDIMSYMATSVFNIRMLTFLLIIICF